MKSVLDGIDQVIDNFFHLPTLIAVALLGLIVVWFIFELHFDVGNGFARLSSNQGAINLYWANGCCDLNWQ